MSASHLSLPLRWAISLLGLSLLTGCALSWSSEQSAAVSTETTGSAVQWPEDPLPAAAPPVVEAAEEEEESVVTEETLGQQPTESPTGEAQPLNNGSTLIETNGSDNDLPLVIVLPHTGGTAQRLFAWVYPSGVECECRLLLLAGWGNAADYATASAWSETLARYESAIARDLEALRSRGLRPRKILLAGFSMGGDLAWALNLRNPAQFDGGLVMGSRMSYRNPAAVKTMQERQTRFFFTMGDQEQPARVQGTERARALLTQSGIAHEHHLTSGAHIPAPVALFEQGLRYLTAH